MAAVAEFESLSVLPKTKGIDYETTGNRLTEESRNLLTALSVFRWHRTADSGVNSLRERYNRTGRCRPGAGGYGAVVNDEFY